jgi:hypothetical protein
MPKCCSTCCNRISRKLAALTGQAPTGQTEGSSVASESVQDETNAPRTEESSVTSGPPAGNSVVVDVKPEIAPNREEGPVVEEKTVRQEPQILPPHPLTMVEPRPVARIIQPVGADNSETDSADEMGASQNAAAEAQANSNNINPHANVSRSNGNIGQVLIDVILPSKRQVPRISLLQEALTVRDLVSNVIESHLKRSDLQHMSAPLGVGSPVYPPGPSESPTITSILKDSQRNYAVGRSSAPLTIVTNTAPTQSPRLMMSQPHDMKQQTILVIDQPQTVRFLCFVLFCNVERVV